MDLASIYRKTEKGKKEVSERPYVLEGQARRLLIMIDGQRSSAELAVYVRAGEFESTLERLVSEGYVEAAGESDPARVARAPAADDPEVFTGLRIWAETEIRTRISGRMAELLVQEIDGCASALELREKLRAIEDSLKRLLGEEEAIALARRIGIELTRLAP